MSISKKKSNLKRKRSNHKRNKSNQKRVKTNSIGILFAFIAFISLFVEITKSVPVLSEEEKLITQNQILENPNDIKLNYKYARQQFAAKNIDEGIKTIEKLAQIYPNNIQIKLDLLAIYKEANLEEKALAIIDEIKKNENTTENNLKFVEKFESTFKNEEESKTLLSHMTGIFKHQVKSSPSLLANMEEIGKISESILKNRSIKNEYVAKKNVTWSQILQNPKDMKLNYQFARQQFKAGHVKEGISVIKRMSKIYPDNIKIKLDLLGVYKQTDMKKEAFALIKEIKQNQNTTDIQLDFVKQIESSFNFIHSEPVAPPEWMISALISYGYNQDNNVSSVTKDNKQISNNEVISFADPKFDNTSTKNIGVTAFKFFGEKSSFMINANLGNSDQHQGTSGDYDNYGMVFSMDTYLGDFNFAPFLMISKYENKYSAEMLSNLVGINGSFLKGERHKFSYGYSLTDTKYNQNSSYDAIRDFNSTTDSFSLGYNFYKNDKISFTTGLTYADSDVLVDAGNDYSSYDIDLRANFSLPWAYFSIGESLTFTDYKNADTSLSTNKRSDTVNTVDLSISKALGDFITSLDPNKNLVMNLAFERTFSESNIMNYDYISDAVSFGLSKSFDLSKMFAK